MDADGKHLMNRMLLHRREIQKDASVLGMIGKPNVRGKKREGNSRQKKSRIKGRGI